MTKLLIIGGGAGGPTAAARARRLDENAEIIIFERGEHVSYAHCGLPYFIGGVITDRNLMTVSTPDKFRQRYNIEVRTRSVVKAIDSKKKEIEITDLVTDKSYYEQYDKLLLSPGADPVRPPLPGIDGENIYVLRNLTDADVILSNISGRKPERAVVVGGGFIGLEIAENLKKREIDTIIVEKLDKVLPPLDPEMAEVIQRSLKSNGIKLILSTGVVGFANDKGSTIVKLEDGQELSCDIVMLSIGVKPNVQLARIAGIEIGEKGGIKVDQYMQTSEADVYAVGDAVETTSKITGEQLLVPLAGIANRQARLAVDNMYGRQTAYRGTLGTAIINCFDITAAVTGANEYTLKRLLIPYEKCYLHPNDHANYYPNSIQMIVKLLFSPDGGRILGAQIVGKNGVDKRIDIFATAIEADMSVEDLTHLELSYSPQYGTAKDAINMSGYVASNMLRGDAPTIYWDELENSEYENDLLLDVRTKEEAFIDMVNNAQLIPVDELRNNLDKLPENVPINIFCASGIRSYIASRILNQKGYKTRNISGGIRMRRYFKTIKR